MNYLVIYDSKYGNTEQVACTIAETLSTVARPAQDVEQSEIQAADILVFGTPTQGGQPSAGLVELLNNIPSGGLQGKLVAVFDTRFAQNEHGFGLKMLMRTIGFAAPKVAKTLTAKGGRLVEKPEGFIVTDKSGPLANNELQRAIDWALQLRSSALLVS